MHICINISLSHVNSPEEGRTAESSWTTTTQQKEQEREKEELPHEDDYVNQFLLEQTVIKSNVYQYPPPPHPHDWVSTYALPSPVELFWVPSIGQPYFASTLPLVEQVAIQINVNLWIGSCKQFVGSVDRDIVIWFWKTKMKIPSLVNTKQCFIQALPPIRIQNVPDFFLTNS